MNNMCFAVYVSKTFTDVYPDVDSFVQAQKETGLIKISDDSLRTLYSLIYAQYGDRDVLADTDRQFNYQIASKIYQYGQAWEAKVKVQDTITEFNEEDLTMSGRSILNSANTAGERPQNYDEVINKIQAQNVSTSRKGKLDAYMSLADSIEDYHTKEFISKFEELFSIWPTGYPDDNYWIPDEWLEN